MTALNLLRRAPIRHHPNHTYIQLLFRKQHSLRQCDSTVDVPRSYRYPATESVARRLNVPVLCLRLLPLPCSRDLERPDVVEAPHVICRVVPLLRRLLVQILHQQPLHHGMVWYWCRTGLKKLSAARSRKPSSRTKASYTVNGSSPANVHKFAGCPCAVRSTRRENKNATSGTKWVQRTSSAHCAKTRFTSESSQSKIKSNHSISNEHKIKRTNSTWLATNWIGC